MCQLHQKDALDYMLALRDLPEMFQIRDIVFIHETVRDWETNLTPALATAACWGAWPVRPPKAFRVKKGQRPAN
jgi:transposase-like protein